MVIEVWQVVLAALSFLLIVTAGGAALFAFVLLPLFKLFDKFGEVVLGKSRY